MNDGADSRARKRDVRASFMELCWVNRTSIGNWQVALPRRSLSGAGERPAQVRPVGA